MLPYHQRLAKVALDAIEKYGFVLAGGYAISANGMGNRPSSDVDLFTNSGSPEQFAAALNEFRTAFGAAGLVIEDRNIRPLFASMFVTDPATGEASEIQLGMNYRAFPPHRIEIGPVLDERDAVAGKMSALWSRGECRDYIDIDTVLASGRFTKEEVLAIGDSQEALPMDREMLAERLRGAAGRLLRVWS